VVGDVKGSTRPGSGDDFTFLGRSSQPLEMGKGEIPRLKPRERQHKEKRRADNRPEGDLERRVREWEKRGKELI